MKFKSGRYTGVVRHLKVPGTNRAMSSAEILARFGLKKIPPDYEGQLVIENVLVRIMKKSRKGMEKRVFALCPDGCNGWFEAGHLHQHTEARHT